jgi:alpha-mannosidase
MVQSKIGKYSGSKRLDPSNMKEPDAENDFSRKMWLEDVAEDDEFYEDIKSEIEEWKKSIQVTSNPDKLDIHLVGQSHIDMAWKWRYEQTRQKGVMTFEKAIYHAKKFPNEFCYAASEPVLIQWLLEDAPKVYEELKEVVKTGGVELVGGSWVEPDCMMPSGEAFVRQRLYGMRFYQKHFNILPKVEWFLDSFGYNIGLPQILKKSGAEYFWTSKITWNRQTIYPFVNFWWESPDGTQLLTSNFQQGWAPLNSWIRFEIGRHPIKEGGRRKWDYTIDYEDIDEEIDDDPDKVIPPIGIFAGKGNGGHGPTHQEVAFNQAVVKSGFAKWSRAENFFKALEAYGDKLPIWADELYLEYHRGTFSVHFEVKRHNRYYENKIVAVENLAALLAISSESYTYPVDKFEAVWKTVLLNQFHDVLPGSSIPEVYDDIWDMWNECNEGIDKLIQGWAKSIAVPKGTQITFSNPLAWARESPAFIPISAVSAVSGEGKPPYIKLIDVSNESNVIIGQPIEAESGDQDDTKPAGWWTVVSLGSLATKCYKVEVLEDSSSISSSAFKVSDSSISNGKIALELDPKTGGMTKLTVEGLNDGKNLLKGDQSNLTVGFLDDFPNDHAWNIKPEYWKYPLDIPNDNGVKINIKEDGPVFVLLEITRTLGEGDPKEKLSANSPIGANSVTQSTTLFKGCSEINLKYEADWKQPWLMLKVRYDTATDAEDDVSDQCYCAIKRSTRPKVRPDQARYEKIMQKYVDLSTPDNKWGIALLNEGKYAYDSNEGTMKLTMLRTPMYPTSSAEAWVNEERKIRLEADGTEIPTFVDLGFVRCRYALLPHEGGSLMMANKEPSAIVKHSAEEFNNPIVVNPISADSPKGSSYLVDGTEILTCAPDNVIITALKQKEWEKSNNLILRVTETSGYTCEEFKITFCKELASKINNVIATDLLERPIESNLIWDAENGIITSAICGFEIISYELQLK